MTTHFRPNQTISPSDMSHLDEWPREALETLKVAVTRQLAERSLGMDDAARIARMKHDAPDDLPF